MAFFATREVKIEREGYLSGREVELEVLILNEMCKVIPLNLMVLLSGFRYVSMSYVTLDFEILSPCGLGMTIWNWAAGVEET
ncbi:MAG: hypothetical protein K6E61_08945 [Bacteroidales bacterium]|nr:hypothetical protein [Bacteroidales bacterium]